ncbi:MAG TPA: hydrogenase maturation nickel metallochaperone HypA [Anaerolineales bacterium]|nr:hydrogenase maturation nickel metallochaperone HypA [Anaerolineales bacterium]
MPQRNQLDLIRSILNQVLAQAKEANLRRIEKVHLMIGEIAELDRMAIQSQWAGLSKGTPAEQAQLHFRLIRAEVQCMSCFEKYHPEGGAIDCPYCGSFGAKVLAGEECHLESIE